MTLRLSDIVDELGIRVAFELNYPDEGHVGMQPIRLTPVDHFSKWIR